MAEPPVLFDFYAGTGLSYAKITVRTAESDLSAPADSFC